MQVPEPLLLAEQLMGAAMKDADRPLYSYSLTDCFPPLGGANGQQQMAPQQQQQQHPRGPGLQHTNGRYCQRQRLLTGRSAERAVSLTKCGSTRRPAMVTYAMSRQLTKSRKSNCLQVFVIFGARV